MDLTRLTEASEEDHLRIEKYRRALARLSVGEDGGVVEDGGQ